MARTDKGGFSGSWWKEGPEQLQDGKEVGGRKWELKKHYSNKESTLL